MERPKARPVQPEEPKHSKPFCAMVATYPHQPTGDTIDDAIVVSSDEYDRSSSSDWSTDEETKQLKISEARYREAYTETKRELEETKEELRKAREDAETAKHKLREALSTEQLVSTTL